MKKIFWLLLTLPFVFQSCLKDDEDIFPDSAADRMDKALKLNKEVLIGASNGWIMEYFPEKTQKYGGYTILVKFDANDDVTVSTERGGAGVTETSMYELIGDSGPVLTFNTHNSLFHYFSEPKNPDGIGPTDSGMAGDYEFLILEATPEKVTMKGKKTGNRIIMTPISADTDWEKLMEQYLETDAKDVAQSYKVDMNGKEASASVSYRTITVTYPGENNEVAMSTGSYRIVPSEIVFYEPLELGGIEISEMQLSVGTDKEVILTDQKSGTVFTEVLPDAVDQLLSRNWYFHYDNLGAYGKSQWDIEFTKYLFPNDRDIYYAYLGTLSGFYGFCFAGVKDNTAEPGVLIYSYKKVAGDQFSIQYAGSVAGSGLDYWNNYAIYNLARPLGTSSSSTKTFTVVANDKRQPTLITLTDTANPDNVFTLSAKTTYWPYPFEP